MSGINVRFGASDAGFSSTVSKVRNSVNSLDSNVRKVSGSINASFKSMALGGAIAGAGVAAGMAVIKAGARMATAAIGSLGDALDLGGELSDLSARTGESAGNLLLLRRAFDNSGVGAEKVGTSLNRLQKFMTEASAGSEKSKGMVEALGLSMSDLSGKTPTEQMKAFAGRIMEIQDPAIRSAAAMKIFGKSGGQLLPMFADFSGEIETAKTQLGSLPGVMDRNAKIFDTVSDNLTSLKSKVTEIAAGFLEKAAPALEAFTTKLTGIDATAWGKSLMDTILRVSDILVGAFKSPEAAIALIGSSLSLAMRESGNALLNGFITASQFLTKVVSSDIPSAIISVIGASLQKTFADSAKYMADAMLGVIKFFTEDFGKAAEQVIQFLSTSFKSLFKFVASDFFNAITNPLDFLSGKMMSAFSDASSAGGLTFKSAFSDGIETSLGKLSTGLGEVSTKYGEQIKTGTQAVRDELGRVVAEIEPSARDFFGAAPAAERVVDGLRQVEDTGRKFREQVQDSMKPVEASAAKTKDASAGVRDNMVTAAMATEKAAEKVKETLTLSEEIIKKINEAQAKNAVDPGGRLAARAEAQISKGRFKAATRTAGKISRNEEAAEIATLFADSDNPRAFGRSLQDMAKEAGVKTFGRTSSQIRSDLLELTKQRNGQLPPGKQGQPGQPGQPQNKAADPMDAIKLAVEEIRNLVKLIEPKLPTVALGV